jgi:hypothetical protein
MTPRGGDTGLVGAQVGNRIHVGSRVRMRGEWAAKSTPPPVGAGPV